jgi:hypothetical protein
LKDPLADPTQTSDAFTPPPMLPPSTAPSVPTSNASNPPTDEANLKPRYAAAFSVAPDLLITAADAVRNVAEIRVETRDGGQMNADVLRLDDESGLALLRVPGKKMLYLSPAASFSGGNFICIAFPEINMFNPRAELINGTAPKGDKGWKIRLERHPRLPGGPLLSGGKVVGVELASRETDPGECPAATLEQVRKLLGADAPPEQKTPLSEPRVVMMQLTATPKRP